VSAAEVEEEPDEDINDRGTWVVVEVEALFHTDWPERLAKRLDYPTPGALADALKRWGRDDLAAWFEKAGWDGLVNDSKRTLWARKNGAIW
jgi:hypothetical protein